MSFRDKSSEPFVRKTALTLLLVGTFGTLVATVLHRLEPNPHPMHLVLPPTLAGVFLLAFFYFLANPKKTLQTVWAAFLIPLFSMVIPSWYLTYNAFISESERLIDTYPPVSAGLLVLLLLTVLLFTPRQAFVIGLFSWTLVGLPILVYLFLNTDELFTPRGQEIFMSLGPLMMIVLIFIPFQKGVRKRMETLQKERSHMQELAERDSLTGLYNRRAGENFLSAVMAGAEHQCGLILFDIDRFKKINDTFGHPAGDAVLCEVTRRCGTLIRKSDRFSRWGGEEFLVVLAGVDEQSLIQVGNNLRMKICGTTIDPVGTVSASFGATLIQPEDTSEAILARVDEALYQAKEGGRNVVVFS